jgi:hypothetical protein
MDYIRYCGGALQGKESVRIVAKDGTDIQFRPSLGDIANQHESFRPGLVG